MESLLCSDFEFCGIEFFNYPMGDKLTFSSLSDGHLEIIQFITMSHRLEESGYTFPGIHVNEEEGIRWACDAVFFV